MAIHDHPEFSRVGTYTERVKDEATRVEDRKEQRAQRRFAIARYAFAYMQGGHSMAKITVLLEDLMRAAPEAIAPGPIPARQHVWRLATRYAEGARSISDYHDQGRRGRRPGWVHPDLAAFIANRLNTAAPKKSLKLLWKEADDFATKCKIPTIGYDKFLSIAKAHGRDTRTAAHYGVRAGELRGAHGTLAVRYTHDCHTLDAFELPRWYRAWDPDLEQFVSVCPTGIIQQDYRSDVVVGRWVADATRRRDENGKVCRSGIDTLDVKATLLSGALPEFASPATAEFAGCMPLTLRFDRHATHESLRADLRDVATKLQLRVDPFFPADDQPEVAERVRPGRAGAPDKVEVSLIDTPALPAVRPMNRGKVERRIQMIKQYWPDDQLGHVDKYTPIDRWTEDDSEARRRSAADGSPEPRRLPIRVEDLPDISEAIHDLDAVIHYWNYEHKSALTRDTARARYHRYSPRSPRKGTDVLALCETRTAFVSEPGIVIYADAAETTRTVFASDVPDGPLAYKLDQTVTFKLDPLYRGLFVRIGDRVHMLPRKAEWSAAPGRAEQVAREQRARAGRAASEAAQARGREYDLLAGPGALTQAMKEAKAQEELVRAAKRAAARPKAPSGQTTKGARKSAPQDGAVAASTRAESTPSVTPASAVPAAGQEGAAPAGPTAGGAGLAADRPTVAASGGPPVAAAATEGAASPSATEHDGTESVPPTVAADRVGNPVLAAPVGGTSSGAGTSRGRRATGFGIRPLGAPPAWASSLRVTPPIPKAPTQSESVAPPTEPAGPEALPQPEPAPSPTRPSA